MSSRVDPKEDYAFKRLNGDEDNALVLVDLLNAVVNFPAGKVVSGVTLLNPYVAKDFAAGKVPILDIRAHDDPGRHFLLEMQLFVRPGFGKRALYYWADVHSKQLHQGESYETLLPTYGICFVNGTMFSDAHWHHTFHVCDTEQGVMLCKDLEIHVLELNKFDLAVEQVKTPLERWCYFYKHGATLSLDQLPTTLDFPIIRKALEVLMRISQSELEMQRYWEQQRIDRDAASLAADVRAAKEEARLAKEEARLAKEEAKRAEEEAKRAEEEAKRAEEKAKLAQEEAKLVQEEAKLAQEKVEQAVKKGTIIGLIQAWQQHLNQPETPQDELSRLSEDNLRQLEESLKRQLSIPKATNGTPPANPT